MRVVIAPSAYFPRIGGVEVLSANLASTLQSLGHEIEVWTSSVKESKAAEIHDGVTVRRFDFRLPNLSLKGVASSLLPASSTLLKLRSAIVDFQPDLIHVQCFSGNGVYLGLLSNLMRIPLVISLQGETIMDDNAIYESSSLLRAALRRATRYASVTTACSQFALSDAESRVGIRPRTGVVVFNGVEDSKWTRQPSDAEPRFIVALGRLVRNKGFDLLLDAFATVADHMDVELHIAGIGPEREILQSQVCMLGLQKRVRFLGALNRDSVESVLSRAVALVVPSRVEPFGIVVLEGWRAGIPVIATSNGGPREFVVSGENGLLINPFDRLALGEAIRQVVVNSELRSRLTNGGRKCLGDFTWNSIAVQYVELYHAATAA